MFKLNDEVKYIGTSSNVNTRSMGKVVRIYTSSGGESRVVSKFFRNDGSAFEIETNADGISLRTRVPSIAKVNSNGTVAAVVGREACVCEISILMMAGCSCGHIVKKYRDRVRY